MNIRNHIPAALLDRGYNVLYVWAFLTGAIGALAIYGLPLWITLYALFWVLL